MWNREELVWAAGLFEGEGTIWKRGQRSKTAWSLRLAMTDEDVVKSFHARVRLGKVRGPVLQPNPKWKPYWVWQCDSKPEVYALCVALWPFMGQRRRAKMTEAIKEMPPVYRVRKTA